MFCQCRRDVLSGLTDYLACGQRKMGAWLATLKRVEVAFDDQAEAFENINTRAGLGRFEGDGTRR